MVVVFLSALVSLFWFIFFISLLCNLLQIDSLFKAPVFMHLFLFDKFFTIMVIWQSGGKVNRSYGDLFYDGIFWHANLSYTVSIHKGYPGLFLLCLKAAQHGQQCVSHDWQQDQSVLQKPQRADIKVCVNIGKSAMGNFKYMGEQKRN